MTMIEVTPALNAAAADLGLTCVEGKIAPGDYFLALKPSGLVEFLECAMLARLGQAVLSTTSQYPFAQSQCVKVTGF